MLKTDILSERSSCLNLFGDSSSKMGSNLGLEAITSSEDFPSDYFSSECSSSCWAKQSKLLEDRLVRE
jgi:hypothetical protein